MSKGGWPNFTFFCKGGDSCSLRREALVSPHHSIRTAPCSAKCYHRRPRRPRLYKDVKVGQPRSGRDPENHPAAAVLALAIQIAAFLSRSIQVPVTIHGQARIRDCSIRPAGEAVQHGLFAARIELEDSPTGAPVAVAISPAEDRRSIQISAPIDDQRPK